MKKKKIMMKQINYLRNIYIEEICMTQKMIFIEKMI